MSYSKDKAKEIAEQFLSDYNNDSNVKEALIHLGFKIVPNSLKLLIEGFEKAGYCVTKKGQEEPIQNENLPKEEHQIESEPTIPPYVLKEIPPLPPKLDLTPPNEVHQEESKNEVLPLFLGRKVEEEKPKLNTVESPSTSPIEDNRQVIEQEISKTPVFQSNSEQVHSIWKKALEDIKTASVPIFSLVNKATLLDINEEFLTIGYATQQSYLLRQFVSRIKDEQQAEKIDELISHAFNHPLKLRAVLEEDFQQSIKKDMVQQKQEVKGNLNLPLFGGR